MINDNVLCASALLQSFQKVTGDLTVDSTCGSLERDRPAPAYSFSFLSRISKNWLPVDSKSTDPTLDPCLRHFRIYFEPCHQVL